MIIKCTLHTSAKYRGMMNDGILNPRSYAGCNHITNAVRTYTKTKTKTYPARCRPRQTKNIIEVLTFFFGSLTFRRHLIKWKLYI